MLDKVNYVLGGEQGASNVEIIVWISVVLVIATILFVFRDTIVKFVQNATNKVASFKVDGDDFTPTQTP